jgi:hypothetical protein
MTKLILLLTAACAAFLLVGLGSAGAAGGDVTCTDAFSGTARDVIVPDDNFCDLSGATVTRDVREGSDAGIFAEGLSVGRNLISDHDGFAELGGTTIGNDVRMAYGSEIHLERTTIGSDLLMSHPASVQTGMIGPDTPGGLVTVGRDVVIDGGPGYDFVFDGMCALHVGHDLRVVNRSVNLGIGLGDGCPFFGAHLANRIDHDLVVTGNSAETGFFGPSGIEVGNNIVGHDLIFTNNTAVSGGILEVADNTVGHDAICRGNSPAAGKDIFDGPNIVAGKNTCG